MGYGIVIVLILLLITGYVVIQETRARLYWRKLVREGNLEAIRSLTESQVNAWRVSKVPRGTAPDLWHDVQTVEIVDVGRDSLQVACGAEGRYAFVDGVRREVGGPLDGAFRLTAKLADLLLYDIPDVRFERVRIDVYSTFRGEGVAAAQRCILSTTVAREVAEAVDWDTASPEEIVAVFGGRYHLSPEGAPLPLDVEGGPALQNPVPAA